MPLPYPKAEENSKARARELLSAYPRGGMGMSAPAAGPSGQRALPPPSMPRRGPSSADGKKAAARLDRAPRKSGGRTKATKVNVIVNAAPAAQPPVAPLMDGPPPGLIPPGPPPTPPMMPPKPMGPMAGGPPPGMPMMRAKGGKVYTAGAGSGPGREEKIKNYGDNAYIKDPGKVVKGVKGDADGRGN